MSNRDIFPFFFGQEKRELFGWYHPGFGAEKIPQLLVGVVICNPIGDDEIRSHRTVRHLAKSFSKAGFPVLRFDFHGTGDSTGTEEDPERIEVWLKDFDLAIEELRRLSGVQRFVLLGFKFGATLAVVAASRRNDIESLILWSPYLKGTDYVIDSIKHNKVYKALEPASFVIDPLMRPIQGEESLGFILSQSTMLDCDKIDLLGLNKRPANRVLITGEWGGGGLQETLANSLTALGSKVEVYSNSGSDLFLSMINHESNIPEETIDFITQWMITHEGKKKAIINVHPFENQLNFHEEPILFDENKSLFGILHTTKNNSKKRPALVLINAGTVNRIGPHRLYVKMARKWADMGFSVFRIDLSGIGDSAAATGSKENLCYPPSARENIQAAFNVLEKRLGVTRFVLIGLCSGADITFKMGLEDSRIIGAILINPLTFCIHNPNLVEEEYKSHYLHQLLTTKTKWIRLLKGNVNIMKVISAYFGYFISFIRSKVKVTSDQERSVIHALKLKETNVPERLRYLAAKGCDILVAVSQNDPGVHYVDVHFGEAMKALKDINGYRRIDYQGTDHTFTTKFAQDAVINTITEHITSKFL